MPKYKSLLSDTGDLFGVGMFMGVGSIALGKMNEPIATKVNTNIFGTGADMLGVITPVMMGGHIIKETSNLAKIIKKLEGSK